MLIKSLIPKILLTCFSCLCTSGFAAELWRIDGAKLAGAPSALSREMSVELTSTASKEKTSIHIDVPLTSIEQAFIFGKKLVAMGEAGRAASVVIIDIPSKRKIDWFYCYAPQRTSEQWISYVEYYPAHVLGEPTDVLLVYDLGATPELNRASRADPIATSASDAPVKVGLPIFPEKNASTQTYENIVTSPSEAHHLLGLANRALTEEKKLVFVVADGREFREMRDYLAIIDLSQGLKHPVLQQAFIPTGDLKRLGENPQFIRVQHIDPGQNHTLRLLVNRADYGVDYIPIQIPYRMN